MQEGTFGFEYCMGLFSAEYRDYTLFSHGGHWGLEGGYLPAMDLAWGWAVTQEDTWKVREALRNALLDVIVEEFESRVGSPTVREQ
jgi:hypothetical protein